jgi:hypothetical protein
MKVAIMQPYLFPYIGYFQLINAVDIFVLYDDVTFIKGGWINRNFILSQGVKSLITLQLQGASSNVLINQVKVGKNRAKLSKTIQQSYSKAPCFSTVFPLVQDVLSNEEMNLAKFIYYGLRKICAYLDIETKLYLSSELNKNTSLRGQEKVLDICKVLNADQYINMIGGYSLYRRDCFANQGIKLSFLEPKNIFYTQQSDSFEPLLSVIDVMMYNRKIKCADYLKEYVLV